MTFTLDTSGGVRVPMAIYPGYANHPVPTDEIRWCGLTPFTQGYIEALLTVLDPNGLPITPWRKDCPQCVASKFTCDIHFHKGLGFTDLAPETLARIIEDCAKGVDLPFMLGRAYNDNESGGRCFWDDRQAGRLTKFKPLKVTLRDDGKVVFS